MQCPSEYGHEVRLDPIGLTVTGEIADGLALQLRSVEAARVKLLVQSGQ